MMKRHGKYKLNYSNESFNINFLTRDKQCYYCGFAVPAGNQAAVITILSPNVLPVYHFLHLGCWTEFHNNDPKERRHTMAFKKEAKEQQSEIPDISSLDEGSKQWDYNHSEIVDIEVIIKTVTPIVTMYGDAVLCDCVVNDREAKIMFGAVVLVSTLKRIKDKLPVRATVIRVGEYYRFS